MTIRYQPGERELQLAGAFVRYFRAFHNIISSEELDIDREAVLELAASVFFRDLDSDLEFHNAVNMASLYAQADEEALDGDDDEFAYESKSQESKSQESKSQEHTKKDEEPETPDLNNVPGLGDFLAELFDPNRNNRNNRDK